MGPGPRGSEQDSVRWMEGTGVPNWWITGLGLSGFGPGVYPLTAVSTCIVAPLSYFGLSCMFLVIYWKTFYR